MKSSAKLGQVHILVALLLSLATVGVIMAQELNGSSDSPVIQPPAEQPPASDQPPAIQPPAEQPQENITAPVEPPPAIQPPAEQPQENITTPVEQPPAEQPQENITQPPLGENITPPSEQPQENITQPAEGNITPPSEQPQENITTPVEQPQENITPPAEQPPTEPSVNEQNRSVDVQLVYPQKMTRGGAINITAQIMNNGSISIANIETEWNLPADFVIMSSEGDCSVLNPGESCSSQITVKSSYNLPLGKNQVKIDVKYE